MNSTNSWLLFRGNEERSGICSDKLARDVSLFWVIGLEPMISSAICYNNTIYNSTINGRIFAIDIYNKKINWQKYIGSPLLSSPLLHENLLISCTFNTWIHNDDSKHRANNLIYALDIKKEGNTKWEVEILGNIFSSPVYL